jgi:exonuclease SbcD
MKLLHTSDWHVGKQIRGNSRADEHRSVLFEIGEIAEREEVDLLLVAGDLFDTSAPSPESEEIVFDALLRFARTGTEVVVIGGNHDNARRLRALSPVFRGCGVHVLGEPARPEQGGVRSFTARDGTAVNLALLPFVSQRAIVRSEQLMSAEAFQNAQRYSQRLAAIVDTLCGGYSAESVNILMAHAFVTGGAAGGGERAAHLVEEYAVPAPTFPTTAAYVALGHLHKAQAIAGATAIHYCGSPLQLDFGEVNDRKQVNVVELAPGIPAKLRPVELEGGRQLRSYRGTVDQLRSSVADDDSWLRLIVQESHRAGLGDEVRTMFGERVVEVRIESPTAGNAQSVASRNGRTPHELLDEYMAAQGTDDQRVKHLFAELLEADLEMSGADSTE